MAYYAVKQSILDQLYKQLREDVIAQTITKGEKENSYFNSIRGGILWIAEA